MADVRVLLVHYTKGLGLGNNATVSMELKQKKETDHGILWVGLLMGHLQQLLWRSSVDPTQDVKPTTERERTRIERERGKDKVRMTLTNSICSIQNFC